MKKKLAFIMTENDVFLVVSDAVSYFYQINK